MAIPTRAIKEFSELFERFKNNIPKEFIDEFCEIITVENPAFEEKRFKSNFYEKWR